MERRRRDTSSYSKRSGGISIDNSRVDIEGDVAGRDVHKTVNIPPEEKPDEIKTRVRSAAWYAIGTVGMYLFGGLALLIGLQICGFFGEDSSVGPLLACVLVVLGIVFAIAAVFFYKVASRNE